MKLVLCGFVLIAAILQIIYIPMIMIHVPFNVVYYTTLIVLVSLVIALSFYFKKIIKQRKRFKIKITKKEKVLIVVILILVGIQAISSSILFNENADDAFYVSLMEQNKTSDSIYTTAPSLGDDNTIFLSRYMVSGYELFISVLSKVTTISAVTLAHSIIPFFAIILSYVAYYQLARKFFNREKSKIFIILLSVLFLFSGFTDRNRGIMLLSRMWQGKVIFLNIILTLIISNLVSLNKYNQKRNLIALTILNFAAVFFTNTAIFLVPFAYMVFGIIELIKRNWKTFGKLLLTGVPIAIYAIIYLLCAVNTRGSQFVTIELKDVIKSYFGTGYYHILYIISLIVIAIKGTKRAKKYFLVVPVIYALTIYNPLFTNIITKYFTGSEVFWRLFWLLPVEFSIVYSFVIILSLKNQKLYQISILIAEILLLIVMGKFVYTKENGFEIAENKYKIPQYIVDQTQYILDNIDEKATPIVIAPPEPLHATTMRQLTPRIKLLWSRDFYMNEILSGEELEEKSLLYMIEKNMVPTVNTKEYETLLKKYGVNWIIINENNKEIEKYLDEIDNKNKKELEGYLLYQY